MWEMIVLCSMGYLTIVPSRREGQWVYRFHGSTKESEHVEVIACDSMLRVRVSNATAHGVAEQAMVIRSSVVIASQCCLIATASLLNRVLL